MKQLAQGHPAWKRHSGTQSLGLQTPLARTPARGAAVSPSCPRGPPTHLLTGCVFACLLAGRFLKTLPNSFLLLFLRGRRARWLRLGSWFNSWLTLKYSGALSLSGLQLTHSRGDNNSTQLLALT